MEIKRIRLTDLEQNKGQVKGLPSNPRQWGKGELDDLVKSIRETPELLEARGLIVWPYAGKYVILGGNMRFSALREMNEVDAPCYVMPEDTPMEKLREIVIKDNGSFGSWDYDMLANEWDDLPLADLGVPAWDTKNLDEVSAPSSQQEHKDLSGGVMPIYQIAIDCENEAMQELYYNELKDKYPCRVLTL